jgi:hypothetical protein
MTLTDETENLGKALDDMKNRSRALNESLRVLAEEGFAQLSRAAQQQTRQTGGSSKSAGDVAMAELAKVLKAETGEALRQVFIPAQAARGGGLSVVIHNNTPAQVGVRETTDGYDQKTLEITIDRMVAQSLVRGRQTGSVLQNLFGLSPSLAGR